MALYEVTAGKPPNVLGPRLIEAKNVAQALAFAVESWVKVDRCSAARAHVLAGRHVKIEYANGEPPPGEPESTGEAE